ncbi:MAG: PAS domain-containing protein [Sulfurimonadaceae bacterium]|nr:PAS domain-containing protein [Sulfurimonadaceae bacterium]
MFKYNRYDRPIGYDERKLNKSDLIVSKTNVKGIITYANPTFCAITGYPMSELVGKNHNIIRHPDMPRALFELMWQRLQAGKDIYLMVKNLTKDGSFYWVFAYVVPDLNERQEIIGYHSERRAPNMKALPEIINLYEQVKQVEIQDGIETAVSFLTEVAVEKAGSFDNYMYELQNQ